MCDWLSCFYGWVKLHLIGGFKNRHASITFTWVEITEISLSKSSHSVTLEFSVSVSIAAYQFL